MDGKKQTKDEKGKIIVIIRISGMVKVKREIEETLYRMKLRKKYSCIVIKPNKENLGMLEKVKHYVAFGEIDDATLKELKEKRGKESKSFFRLHPPRGGIKSKLQYPKGVLGNNKEKINELVMRML